MSTSQMPPNILPDDDGMALLDKAIADAEQIGQNSAEPGPLSKRQARKNNKRALEDDNRNNGPSKRAIPKPNSLTANGPIDPMVQDEEMTAREEDTNAPNALPSATAAPPNPPAATTTPHFLPTPEEGFPKVHGITHRDVFAMVARDSKECWDSQDGPYILAYLANDRDVQEATERVVRLQSLIKVALGSTPVIVGHAKPSNRRTSDIKPLFPYYIGGLTMDQMDFLTTRGCWSTPTTTAFFIPNPPPPSEFVMTLENLPLAATEENNNIVKKTVQQKIRQNSDILNFIAVNRDNILINYDFLDLLHYVVDSVMVTNLSIVQRGTTTTVFNIYIHPPTLNTNALEMWISKLRKLDYTCIFGTGKPRAPFHCTCCKARDHPAGLCEYLKIPGWNNNQALSKLDAEAAQTSSTSSMRGRGRGEGAEEDRRTVGARATGQGAVASSAHNMYSSTGYW
ncbi:hypothetical protein BD779DRAFT_1713233 [Infundibulicybe gibba]|nr:hypothetical protein BD779DRAFT_1713233 [Infundibulicybe gibba]